MLRLGMRSLVHELTRHAMLLGGSALCIAGFSPTLSAQDVDLSANVRAGGIDSLQREEPGSPIHRSHAVALMAASVEQVNAVVLDYESYRQFMPHFVASRVLSRRGNQALMYAEVSALDGMVTLWVEMQLRTVDAGTSTHVIRAKMLKGNLKIFQAEWQLTPVDATHTLVAFELCADPDLHLPVGNGLISDYNEQEARASITGLRRQLSRRANSASAR